MGSYCRSSFHRELEDCCSVGSQELLPMHWVNVGGLGVPMAGVLLSLLAPMLGIVQSHHESPDGLTSLLYVN